MLPLADDVMLDLRLEQESFQAKRFCRFGVSLAPKSSITMFAFADNKPWNEKFDRLRTNGARVLKLNCSALYGRLY